MAQSTFTLPKGIDPIGAAIATGTRINRVLRVPDIIEFTISDEWLNRPNLYPRQATILKTIFLQDEIFTSYDYSVLAEWAEGFTLNPNPNEDGVMKFQGNHGVQPDVLARIKKNKEDGRHWFREVLAVLGRRAGKGYLGAICGAYVLWNYLSWGDPQEYYGVDRDKNLAGLVFAGKLNQAKTEQFADLTNVIQGAPCFAPYISRPQAESLSVYTPADLVKVEQTLARGIKSDQDYASIRLMPKESTLMSGRGPASFLQYYDEMAHVSSSTARASAEQVYGAATPSLDQFGLDAFLYEGSSPWQMNGQFYENWMNSLSIDAKTGEPIYPEMLMFQLESWDPYKDWDKAPTIKRRGGVYGRHHPKAGLPREGNFAPLKRAVQEYDEKMRRLERANPETFAVERRAHWASSQNAYLNPQRIAEMFLPYKEQTLIMQQSGHLLHTYVAHVDPSKSGANTALAIAHLDPEPDAEGFHHVVFDLIKHWIPGDFDGHGELPDNDRQIDYIYLEKWWNEHVTDAFMPAEFTFDQFDASIIQRVRKYARDTRRPKATKVYERTATKQLNWKMAEAFKTALGLGLIHAPFYEQAEQELIYLQDIGHERVDHPTDGLVQTSDVADALFNVTYALIGEQMSAFLNDEFVDFSISGMLPGGVQPFSVEMSAPDGETSELFSQFSEMNSRRGQELAHRSPSRLMPRDGQRPGFSPANPFGRRFR